MVMGKRLWPIWCTLVLAAGWSGPDPARCLLGHHWSHLAFWNTVQLFPATVHTTPAAGSLGIWSSPKSTAVASKTHWTSFQAKAGFSSSLAASPRLWERKKSLAQCNRFPSSVCLPQLLYSPSFHLIKGGKKIVSSYICTCFVSPQLV